MKKNAFTLVELLGTIILLSIIALIALPTLISSLNASQSEIEDSYKSIAITAARNYVNDHIDEFPKALESDAKEKEYPNGNLEIQMLLDEGYITDTSINEEKTCEMMNDYIKVTSDYRKYNFTYQQQGDDGIC